MALQARHRYIVSRINEAFKLDDEEMIEELIRKENFISRINAFFRANGPTRIFIFCEKLGGNRRSTPEDASGCGSGSLGPGFRDPSAPGSPRSRRRSTLGYGAPRPSAPRLGLDAAPAAGPCRRVHLEDFAEPLVDCSRR